MISSSTTSPNRIIPGLNIQNTSKQVALPQHKALSSDVFFSGGDKSLKTILQARLDSILAGETHVDAIEPHQGKTLLQDAANAGYFDIVAQLLNAQATVDATDRIGNTALQWAAREGHQDIAMELLKAGAKVNRVNMYGITPIKNANSMNQKQMVELLKKYGAAL